MIEELSAGKMSMDIHISGWHTFDFGFMSCLIITGWHRWCFGRMWSQFWCRLSESLWWMCTCAFVPPACLGILCCAILATTAAVSLIFLKHRRVSLHRSLHIVMPRKLNSSVPERPSPAFILKAGAKGGPARTESEAPRPPRRSLQIGRLAWL